AMCPSATTTSHSAHETRGGNRDHELRHGVPAEQIRLMEDGEHDAENHEAVLEPVVRARDLEVAAKTAARVSADRPGCSKTCRRSLPIGLNLAASSSRGHAVFCR